MLGGIVLFEERFVHVVGTTSTANPNPNPDPNR